MSAFNQQETYQHIDFADSDFPFGCYTVNNQTTLAHWQNHLELVFAKIGQLDIYVNGTLFHCNAGDLLLIPKDSLHRIEPMESAIYLAMVIGDELLQSIRQDRHLDKIIAPFEDSSQLAPCHLSQDMPFYPEIRNRLKIILDEEAGRTPHFEAVIKLEMCQLFANLLRNIPELLQTKSETLVSQTQSLKQVLAYISKHYAEKITIQTLCQLMNVSEQHFSRLFKAYTGKTFITYLTWYRLQQAQKLLAHSDLPITQIPDLTGFCNPNYFSRVYKRYYGQAPLKARKSLQAR